MYKVSVWKSEEKLSGLLEQLQPILGRSDDDMKSPELEKQLNIALTHASVNKVSADTEVNNVIQNYEKHELLGDAVLEGITRHFLFCHCNTLQLAKKQLLAEKVRDRQVPQ